MSERVKCARDDAGGLHAVCLGHQNMCRKEWEVRRWSSLDKASNTKLGCGLDPVSGGNMTVTGA